MNKLLNHDRFHLEASGAPRQHGIQSNQALRFNLDGTGKMQGWHGQPFVTLRRSGANTLRSALNRLARTRGRLAYSAASTDESKMNQRQTLPVPLFKNLNQ